MKKKLIVVLALLMFLGLCDVGAYSFMPAYRDGAIPVFAGVSSTVMQADLDNKFMDYAEERATVVLPESEKACNVVGVVVDFTKDRLVRGAKVYLNGEHIVTSGQDGRFQIKNLPAGAYDWDVQALGYKPAEYHNYEVTVEGGTNIFNFFVDKELAFQLNK